MGNPQLYRRLGRGKPLYVDPDFKPRVAHLSARVLQAVGEADLVFVGRSLELVFDFLTGALEATTWRERLQPFQISLYGLGRRPGSLRRQHLGGLSYLWTYADAVGLTPDRILARSRPLALVDVVDRGHTFGNLSALLHHWCGGSERCWRRLKARLRWVCVTADDADTWVPTDSPWTEEYASDHVLLIPLDPRLWFELAQAMDKSTFSYPPRCWGEPFPLPDREDPEELEAARLGRAMFRYGSWSRRALAHRIARRPTHPALEGLAEELLALSGPSGGRRARAGRA